MERTGPEVPGEEERVSLIGDLYETAQWKKEKHVPVIRCADSVSVGEGGR
jgi:desulfoferrodoxin (superoxide reductase-like protein)